MTKQQLHDVLMANAGFVTGTKARHMNHSEDEEGRNRKKRGQGARALKISPPPRFAPACGDSQAELVARCVEGEVLGAPPFPCPLCKARGASP